MKHVPVTLVSYTYNDNALLDGLLCHVDSWNLKPTSIILVDDGSSEPYAPAKSFDNIPIQLIRFETNKGFFTAKSTGISAAKTKFVLSMDADVRLHADWLTHTLPLAADKTIGIASSPLTTSFSNTYLSRYAQLFYSNNVDDTGYVKLIGGGVWLFRKEVWDTTGGMDGFRGTVGSDNFFCKKLLDNGYRNYITKETTATQVRKMSHITMAAKGWATQFEAIKDAVAAGEPFEKAAPVCLQVFFNKMNSGKYEPEFLYFDILSVYHSLLSFAGMHFPEKKEGFTTSLLSPFKKLLNIHTALVADLQKLGHDLQQEPSPHDPLADQIVSIMLSKIPGDWWQPLNDRLPNILEQCLGEEDFSSYYKTTPAA